MIGRFGNEERSLTLFDRATRLGWSLATVTGRKNKWVLRCDGHDEPCETLDEVESWLDHVERREAQQAP